MVNICEKNYLGYRNLFCSWMTIRHNQLYYSFVCVKRKCTSVASYIIATFVHFLFTQTKQQKLSSLLLLTADLVKCIQVSTEAGRYMGDAHQQNLLLVQLFTNISLIR